MFVTPSLLLNSDTIRVACTSMFFVFFSDGETEIPVCQAARHL